MAESYNKIAVVIVASKGIGAGVAGRDVGRVTGESLVVSGGAGM